MKEVLKKMRADMILSSLFCIVFGLVLLLCPGETLTALAQVAAIIMLVVGIGMMVCFFLNWVTGGLSAALGLVLIVIGVWILISPKIIVDLLPVLLGIVLLVHGIQSLKIAIDGRKYNPGWKAAVVLALLSIVFGVLCVICAFGIMKMVMWVIGLILLYDGIANIWIALSASHAGKKFEKRMETIDVEFKDGEK